MRYSRFREFSFNTVIQSIQILSDGRLCIGHPQNFTLYNLFNEQHVVGKFFCSLKLLFVGEKS